ncbi:MAG: hypothetical protein EON96_06715, partial [Caulobacteraceae bacterium]
MSVMTRIQTLALIAAVASGAALIATAAPAQDAGTVYVAQIGDSNRATVRQAAGSRGSNANVTQTGDRNIARIDQTSAGQSALVTQSGEGNEATIAQEGTARGEVELAQSGTGNIASVNQASQVLANVAALRQTGEGNVIALDQLGGNNAATLTQDGDANQMRVIQTGDNNALTWT